MRQLTRNGDSSNVVKAGAIAAAAVLTIGGLAALVLTSGPQPADAPAPAAARAAFTEVRWPFPLDQWGRGKAYECAAADCGAKVAVYVRAKIGFCNCETGVADDEELERISDFILVGDKVAAAGHGRPIAVGWMKGRSRSYRLTADKRPGPAALSIGFNDRCDAIIATAVVPHDRPEEVEARVLEFLNSPTVLRWAQVTLGL
jgi:hypothetical protein